MKRALIEGPRAVVLEETPAPARPADAYLVAVRACGLCTWEQRVYRGATRQYPFIGGHEIGGVVTAGPEGGLTPGTVVAVSRLPRCRRCLACMTGHDNLCAYLTPHDAGGDGPEGLSEHLVVGAPDLMPLPDGRTPAEASLVEPLACVLNSLSVAGVEEGSRLAILGNGFMGILHARAAEAVGADPTVVQTDPVPAGLEHAWGGPTRRLEADHETLTERSPSRRDGEFDAAIVIRDVARNVVAAGHLVKPGGVVSVYASLGRDEDIALPSQLMRRKQLLLTAAASHREVDFAAAAQRIADGAVEVGDLVHRSYPLARVEEALDYVTSHDSARVLVTLDGSAYPDRGRTRRTAS